MKKVKIYNSCTTDEFLNFQATDFALYVHTITEAVVKAHEEYIGCELPINEKVEKAIEEYILELGIATGRYDRALKAYLER